MKTKTINVYEYDELSEKAKEKVLNHFRENNEFNFLSDELTESLKELLIDNKITFDKNTLKCYYSLSYCQGDGLCFIGDFTYKNINIKIKHNSHYYYAKSTDIIFYNSEGKEVENKNTKHFINLYLVICKKLEDIGYKIIEEENSEEYIKELIKSNEYTFRENGEMENL